jgi:DNA-binding transcriptional ArsR family regulator
MTNLEVALHPVRMKILSYLFTEPATPQQMHKDLHGIPPATLYRHIKALLDAGLIEVEQETQRRGATEVTYRLSRTTSQPEPSSDELKKLFNIYLAGILNSFDRFLDSEQEKESQKHGFSKAIFYATPTQLDEFQKKVLEAITPLLKPSGQPHQMAYELSTILLPVVEE